jgi:hypothetical protein
MSDHPCEPQYEKMIERAFVGELGAERWRELSAHLAQCSACRAYHDRLGLIDEAMGKSPLSASMRDRIAEQVIAAASGGRPRPRFSLSAFLTYATAATAVVVLAVMLPFVAKEDEFIPRGIEMKWQGRPPGLGLFCITPPQEPAGKALVDRTVQAVSRKGELPVLPCRLDQELQLAYATPSNRKLYLTVRGETGGEPHWYAPLTPEAGPIELAMDASGQALGWSTRLGVRHEVGTIEVIARFYDDPSRDPIYELAAMLEVRPAR